MAQTENFSPEEDRQKIKQFIKDNWPIITGAATIAGAAVYLTARFLIKKHQSKQENLDNLESILEEAIIQQSNAHALLETGEALATNAGRQETSQAAQELAQNADDPDLTEALETLSQTAKISPPQP